MSYLEKFVQDNIVAQFLLRSVVIVTVASVLTLAVIDLQF